MSYQNKFIYDFPNFMGGLGTPELMYQSIMPTRGQIEQSQAMQDKAIGLLDAIGYLQGIEEPQMGLIGPVSGGTPMANPAPLIPMNVPSLQEYLARMQR